MAMNILVVDANASDRMKIRKSLQWPGFDIILHEAESGRKAVSLLNEMQFDCVFLDYSLPDMDCLKLLRNFYNAETDLSCAPVVMLTEEGNMSVMAGALCCGAQDYLIKDSISTYTVSIVITKARDIFHAKLQRREDEELQLQSQKMEAIGQLTNGIAHDFNNLLGIILGNAGLVLRLLRPEGELDRTALLNKAQVIEIAARRGAALVKALMMFTRQHDLNLEVVDVNVCIQDTYEMLKTILGGIGEIQAAPAADIWPVKIDPEQFQNALINMAVNASETLPKGGKLVFETRNVTFEDADAPRHPDVRPGHYVMVVVSDTGIGMSEGIEWRIFEPFFTTKKTGGGAGLGLSLLYNFIKQSNGHIYCHRKEGHCTAFKMYLPKMEAEEGVGTDISEHSYVGTSP
ncbi:MAG: response regulator [Alphaproteobacteria bacterium]|nr:response regulator [Alphaproteobacteria bacterium]